MILIGESNSPLLLNRDLVRLYCNTEEPSEMGEKILENERMQVMCPAGRFGRSLMAAECNQQMFELLGEYIYSSLYKMMPQEDISRVERALEKCAEDPLIVVEECVHLIKSDGIYDTFIMSISLCRDGEKYYIELWNQTYNAELLEKSEKEKNFLKDFLTLSGGIFFTYRPLDGRFLMFWMDYEQKITMYDMTLDQWEGEMLSRGLVEGKDAVVFQTFCSSVRQTSGEQNYSFHGSILSGGKTKEAYQIRFVSRKHAGEPLVEGIWNNINEQTGDAMDDYITGINLDPLTRVLNKKAVNSYAETSVQNGEEPAIIMIDIDNFKNVNDTYGHPFGDQVVAAVADIIKKVIGGHGVAGRVGGDEFMIVLKNYGDELGLRNYLRGIRTNVTALFQDKVGDDKLSCSLGIARAGIDSNDFRELYRIADRALYIAKQKGRNRYIIYKPELHGRFNTSSDNLDMKEIRGSFYSDRDLNQFNIRLSEFVLHGRGKLPELLEQAAQVLAVDRILVFWGEQRKIIGSWPPELDCTENMKEIFEAPEYRNMFRNDMLQISNINMLEYSMPKPHAVYRESGTRSVMQHFLRDADGELFGFITVEECSTMRGFPKLATQLFGNMCRVINAVLLGEKLKQENLDN